MALNMQCDKLPFALLILAGGVGRRMGQGNKLYLKNGETLLVERTLARLLPHFAETFVLVAKNDGENVRHRLGSLMDRLCINVAEDEIGGIGPLEGLCVGLRQMKSQIGFVIGCDMPDVSFQTICEMSNYIGNNDVTVAELCGFVEPLHGFYSKNCVPAVQASIMRGDKKIKQFYNNISLRVIKEVELSRGFEKSFTNLNTQNDFNSWLKSIAS